MAQEQLTWRSWWDGSETRGPIHMRWDVWHWPTVFVLDHRGVIRYMNTSGRFLDEAVDKLLQELRDEQQPQG